MSQTARIIAVADRVTKALAHRTDPATQTTVVRAYAPDWLDPEYWVDNPSLDFSGRWVYVFPAAVRHQGPATRREDENHYEIVVVVLEKSIAAGSEVAADWLDASVAWVEREVFDRLGDARETDDPVVPDADALALEWVQIYSADLLRQLKLFRSEVRVVYRAIEDTGPA